MNVPTASRALLFQPFPLFDPRRAYQSAWWIGLFVACFLLAFRPFGMHQLAGWQLLRPLVYGLVSALLICLSYFLLFRFLPYLYREETWKVYHQLLYDLLMVSLVGSANYWLAVAFGSRPANFLAFWDMVFACLLVSVMPITVLVLLKYYLVLRKNLQQAQALTQQLTREQQRKSESHAFSETVLRLVDETGKEQVCVSLEGLLLIESVNNYVEIYWEKNGTLTKTLLRNTLQNIEEQVKAYAVFFRCHRSFLVNMDRVQTVNGNSQGYLLGLPLVEQPIPVSRLKNRALKDYIQAA